MVYFLRMSTDYEVVNVSRTLVGIENPTCVESIPILTTSDQLVEANEQFSVSLTSSSFIVTISNSSLLVTIENDDGKSVMHMQMITTRLLTIKHSHNCSYTPVMCVCGLYMRSWIPL